MENTETSRITEDTKIILSIVRPTLDNMKMLNSILDSIIQEIKKENRDIDIVKKILVGDENLVVLGEGPGGIKKDIVEIKKILDISDTPSKSIEDMIKSFVSACQSDHNKIIALLTSRLPWTSRVQGIKDIIMAVGLAVTAAITIINYMR